MLFCLLLSHQPPASLPWGLWACSIPDQGPSECSWSPDSCWGFPKELDQHRPEQLQLPAQSLTNFAHLVWEDAMAPSPTTSCMVHALKPVDVYMQLSDFCWLTGSRTALLAGFFLIVKALIPLDNLE